MRIQPAIDQEKYDGKKATPELTLSYIQSHRFIYSDGKETSVKEYVESDDSLDDYEYRERFLTMFPYEIQPLARWAIIKIRKDKSNNL